MTTIEVIGEPIGSETGFGTMAAATAAKSEEAGVVTRMETYVLERVTRRMFEEAAIREVTGTVIWAAKMMETVLAIRAVAGAVERAVTELGTGVLISVATRAARMAANSETTRVVRLVKTKVTNCATTKEKTRANKRGR